MGGEKRCFLYRRYWLLAPIFLEFCAVHATQAEPANEHLPSQLISLAGHLGVLASRTDHIHILSIWTQTGDT